MVPRSKLSPSVSVFIVNKFQYTSEANECNIKKQPIAKKNIQKPGRCLAKTKNRPAQSEANVFAQHRVRIKNSLKMFHLPKTTRLRKSCCKNWMRNDMFSAKIIFAGKVMLFGRNAWVIIQLTCQFIQLVSQFFFLLNVPRLVLPVTRQELVVSWFRDVANHENSKQQEPTPKTPPERPAKIPHSRIPGVRRRTRSRFGIKVKKLENVRRPSHARKKTSLAHAETAFAMFIIFFSPFALFTVAYCFFYLNVPMSNPTGH